MLNITQASRGSKGENCSSALEIKPTSCDSKHPICISRSRGQLKATIKIDIKLSSARGFLDYRFDWSLTISGKTFN